MQHHFYGSRSIKRRLKAIQLANPQQSGARTHKNLSDLFSRLRFLRDSATVSGPDIFILLTAGNGALRDNLCAITHHVAKIK